MSFHRLVLCGVVFVVVAVAGCSRPSLEASATRSVVRLGYQKTGTLNLVRLRGTLKSELARRGVQIEWIGFPAGPQLLEAMNTGSIDFGHAGDTPPILAQAAGVPFVYVGHEPGRPHAEGILVPRESPIRTVADLRGRRVALNKGSNVHYMLVRALERAGLRYDEIKTVFLPPSDARVAFSGGSVDAWAVWDPYFAEAERNGDARVLTDGAGIVSSPEFMLASPGFAQAHPDLVHVILDAIHREGVWARENLDEIATLFSHELRLEFATLRVAVARKNYGILPMDESTVAEQQQIADTFAALGLIRRRIQVRDAVFPLAPATESLPPK